MRVLVGDSPTSPVSLEAPITQRRVWDSRAGRNRVPTTCENAFLGHLPELACFACLAAR